MSGAPVAASAAVVAKALGPDGAGVCAELIRTLRCGDKRRTEKAARELKKVAEAKRDALYAWRRELLREAMRAEDVRVQWNLTIVIGRLPLKGRDHALAVALMFERLADASGLNRTFALQALWDLSEEDAGLRERAMVFVREFAESGTPAMRARAARLLRKAEGGRRKKEAGRGFSGMNPD